MTMVLYDYVALPECYAVRLLAALLNVPLRLRPIDYYPGREHEQPAFLEINPLGTLPVLDTGRAVLRDWQAALIDLAMQYDPSGRWLPLDPPDGLASVQEWFSLARGLGSSAGTARLHSLIGAPADIDRCLAEAHRHLRYLDRHLWFAERAGDPWLLQGEHPTIADVAVFATVIFCEEGGVDRLDYPAVRRWIDRVRSMPRFIVTSGIFPLDIVQPHGPTKVGNEP